MARQRLQPFLSPASDPRTQHGGSLRAGKRKLARPIDPKRPLHLVMRASAARGKRSMLAPTHAKRVDALVRKYAGRFQVRVHRYANVGNHLHFLIQGRDRRGIQSFLRVLPGQIAQMITGARKGERLERGRFWDALAFSRVVEWGKAFEAAMLYVFKNQLESGRLFRRVEIDRLFAKGASPPAGPDLGAGSARFQGSAALGPAARSFR
jgi:REP element-mobilizing transposase RayT